MNEKLLQAAKLLKQHCESQEYCRGCIFYLIDEYNEDSCGIGNYGDDEHPTVIPLGWEIESEEE